MGSFLSCDRIVDDQFLQSLGNLSVAVEEMSGKFLEATAIVAPQMSEHQKY